MAASEIKVTSRRSVVSTYKGSLTWQSIRESLRSRVCIINHMRRPSIFAFSLMLVPLYSCERQNTIAEMLHETHQNLFGRWQLEKQRIEIFEPYPTTLKLDSTYIGTAEDFYHFVQNDVVNVGKAGKPELEEHAQIFVKSVFMPTLRRNWSIDTLNGKRLVLSWLGRNDDSTDKTIHETLYFNK